jgi:hypothetical protein
MTRVAIYSALYGSYEPAKPLSVGESTPAYMFTDDPKLTIDGWTVIYEPRPVTLEGRDSPMYQAKWWKTHPREALGYSADVAIWIDASITVAPGFVDKALVWLGSDDWAMCKHPGRGCIYDEAVVSLSMPRYQGIGVQEQVDYYRQIGHPANWGLFANGVSVRRLTPAVLNLGYQWWWECATRTWQDQLSMPVLVRLAEDLKWNTNIVWGDGWSAADHPAG